MTDELSALFHRALDGDPAPLEQHLEDNSRLPGPRMNLDLVLSAARAAGAAAADPSTSADRLEALLDRWAQISAEEAPADNPRVVLPATAALAYGEVAVARPDWWDDELDKLRHAAADGRWRVREMVAAGLQSMLARQWDRTVAALRTWIAGGQPLEVRAAAAAVAEPPLLGDEARWHDAVSVQEEAVAAFAAVPEEHRRDEEVRVLRQALGFTVGVAVAAAPEEGFELLHQLASSGDPDLRWVARENLKKARLRRHPEELGRIRLALGEG